jgi:hypothetical protein
MLRILNEEDGFDIKERELMRVSENRWLLRVPNGMKSHPSGSSAGVGTAMLLCKNWNRQCTRETARRATQRINGRRSWFLERSRRSCRLRSLRRGEAAKLQAESAEMGLAQASTSYAWMGWTAG